MRRNAFSTNFFFSTVGIRASALPQRSLKKPAWLSSYYVFLGMIVTKDLTQDLR